MRGRESGDAGSLPHFADAWADLISADRNRVLLPAGELLGEIGTVLV